jgi:hypothetical protein
MRYLLLCLLKSKVSVHRQKPIRQTLRLKACVNMVLLNAILPSFLQILCIWTIRLFSCGLQYSSQ